MAKSTLVFDHAQTTLATALGLNSVELSKKQANLTIEILTSRETLKSESEIAEKIHNEFTEPEILLMATRYITDMSHHIANNPIGKLLDVSSMGK